MRKTGCPAYLLRCFFSSLLAAGLLSCYNRARWIRLRMLDLASYGEARCQLRHRVFFCPRVLTFLKNRGRMWLSVPLKGDLVDELNQFVNLLLQAAVTALAPIAVAYVVATLRALRDRARAALSVEQWSIVEAVAATVVSAAEQSGLANHIAAEGRAKKEWAIAEATRILARYGLSVDLETLSALIEAEVFRQLNTDKA